MNKRRHLLKIFRRTAGCALSLIVLSSCATVSSITSSGTAKKYETLRASPEFTSEKALLRERMGGKTLCPNTGVSDLIASAETQPSKDCLYPASKLVVDPGDTFDGRSLRQAVNTLRVVQVASDGFIVNAQYQHFNGYRWTHRTSDKAAFIKRGDESGIVDGAFLDPAHNFDMYEYLGVIQYQRSIGGLNTVHSFRKISRDEILAAQKGLKVYGMLKEFFIENKLWDRVEDLEKLQQSGAIESKMQQ